MPILFTVLYQAVLMKPVVLLEGSLSRKFMLSAVAASTLKSSARPSAR